MRLTALLSLGLLTVACAPAADAPADDAVPAAPTALSPADLEAVRAVETAFAAAMNARDTTAVFDFYTDDARLMPPDSPIIEGAGIREMLVGMIDGGISDLVLTPTATVGQGDLAYQVGTGSYTMGGVTHRMKYVEVLRKGADGKWRYVVDMFSSVEPPAAGTM